MTSDKEDSDEIKGIDTINKVIHEPARLLIMAHLYVVDKADFVHLIAQTGMTWGNLSSHMTKLEAAGYIEVEKGFKGKKPSTMLRLTNEGREAFSVYRKRMTELFTDPSD